MLLFLSSVSDIDPKYIYLLVNFLINDYNQQKSWRCCFYAPSILTNTTIQGARTA